MEIKMIVFTIDSISSICALLKDSAVPQPTDIFFDDGLKRHKVTEFNLVEQCFDVNGMYQTHTVGYKMNLITGSTLKLDINGELLVDINEELLNILPPEK